MFQYYEGQLDGIYYGNLYVVDLFVIEGVKVFFDDDLFFFLIFVVGIVMVVWLMVEVWVVEGVKQMKCLGLFNVFFCFVMCLFNVVWFYFGVLGVVVFFEVFQWGYFLFGLCINFFCYGGGLF